MLHIVAQPVTRQLEIETSKYIAFHKIVCLDIADLHACYIVTCIVFLEKCLVKSSNHLTGRYLEYVHGFDNLYSFLLTCIP